MLIRRIDPLSNPLQTRLLGHQRRDKIAERQREGRIRTAFLSEQDPAGEGHNLGYLRVRDIHGSAKCGYDSTYATKVGKQKAEGEVCEENHGASEVEILVVNVTGH